MSGLPVQDSDRDLLALVAAGDSGALGRIYDRHAGDCFALATIVLRDEAAAGEVVIDTFVDLWRTAADPGSCDDGFLRAHLLALVFRRARALACPVPPGRVQGGGTS